MTPELTSSACSRCETLPAVPAAAGILYLRFPLQHSLGKVLVWLARNSPPWERKGATVCISVGDREELAGILRGINTVLSSQEQQDARAVYHPEGYQARPEDFFDAQPLQGFQAQVNSGWLLELLKERRLTSWFQPIVEVQAPDRMLGHECLLRGQTGEGVIGAGPILTAARQAGLLFQLDLAARRSALECAAREQAPGLIFINFSPAAIYDPQYCLRSTLATLDELGLDRSRCVFEVTETDHVADREHLQSILDFYRECGFLVALDDLGSGYSSLLRLHELRLDFVKLDSSLIQGADRDPLKSVLAAKLLEAARGMGIRSVAEGVETPGELAWLQQHEADYVQGFLIARPAPHPWTGAGTATQSSR